MINWLNVEYVRRKAKQKSRLTSVCNISLWVPSWRYLKLGHSGLPFAILPFEYWAPVINWLKSDLFGKKVR